MWKVAEPSSGLWAELGLVLAMGGRFSAETTFAAPYVYSAWPDDVDAFEHVAIVGSDVRVRAAPRLDAERLTALSFAIVARGRDADQGSADFTAIRLADGRTGYVSSTYVRSPIGHRAIFNRVEWYQSGGALRDEWERRNPGKKLVYDPGRSWYTWFFKYPGWRAREGHMQPALGIPGVDPCPPACPGEFTQRFKRP